MKSGKAAGPSGIVVKMIKAAGYTGATMIYELATVIIPDGKVPADWEQSFIVCLYKGKSEALDRGNYRGHPTEDCPWSHKTGGVYCRLPVWLYAGDLVIISDSLEECVRRLLIWKEAIKKKALRVNAGRQRSWSVVQAWTSCIVQTNTHATTASTAMAANFGCIRNAAGYND